ncbi:MAG: RNA methyltransferase [Gammaproteobacteria bacterium]|nr:RNA methyltransferase [Gammaproteobacteria bacterium]
MRPLERIINDLEPEVLTELTGHLLTIVNPGRVARIDTVLDSRTRHLTVALENIYQSHNASAVIRSCECFGIQDLHVIESANHFEPNRNIVQGASKWVTLRRYRGANATAACLQGLKDGGYRIAAMCPEAASIPIAELPVDTPLALCFGSEEPGLSGTALSLADFSVAVPMQGFTQSLNLSVSAGIALEQLGRRLRQSQCGWGLAPEERHRLRTLWLAQSTPGGRHIVDRYLAGPAD